MAAPTDLITAISAAIAEVSGLIKEFISGADIRRMSAAIEAAEQYIMVNEKTGQYKDLTEEKKAQYLTHVRKRFFKYNN
jgi:arabinogalactan endo-1,4-beta-galactosidase